MDEYDEILTLKEEISTLKLRIQRLERFVGINMKERTPDETHNKTNTGN